jgi:hypothetical protein
MATYQDDVLLLLTVEPDKRLIEAFRWVAEKQHEDHIALHRPNTPSAILQPPPADREEERRALMAAVRSMGPEAAAAGLPKLLERPKGYRINTERVSRLLSLNPGMNEVVNLYDAVERLLPAKPVIIINRADALARAHGIQYKALVETLHRDLVRGANCTLLLVQERDENTQADKSVDGVVVLRDISRTEDFLGEIAISSLQDVVLKRARMLYRFAQGRIKLIESATVGSTTED